MRCLALACGDPVWLLAGREVGELRDEASRRVSPVAGCLAELVAEAGDQGVQLTAFAVWRYFRRNQHTESAARTVAAPLAAGILLSGAALLIIWKIGLLTAAGPAVNWTLIGSVPDVDAEELTAASPDPQPSTSLA